MAPSSVPTPKPIRGVGLKKSLVSVMNNPACLGKLRSSIPEIQDTKRSDLRARVNA